MKPRFFSQYLMAAFLLGAGIAGAATRSSDSLPSGDDRIAQAVQHDVLTYANFSIFDDVNYRVSNGQVELIGAVRQPFEKTELGQLVFQIAGVNGVTNDLKVLPLSSEDDRLRFEIARAIYGDPALSRSTLQGSQPVHIIVENGHVTLTGVVNNDLEKTMAGTAASDFLSFGPLVNNLEVEHPAPLKG